MPTGSVFLHGLEAGRYYRDKGEAFLTEGLQGNGIKGQAKAMNKVRILLYLLLGCCAGAGEEENQRENAVVELREIGALLFTDAKSGGVTEIVANGNPGIGNEHMKIFALFPGLTDISLEGTRVSSEGIRQLQSLKKLEWLNLYRCPVGNEGIRHLSKMESIKLLPIGMSGVDDDGLRHVGRMSNLEYLGLRGNEISGKGMLHIAGLKKLKGLHLGETKVDDDGIKHLAGLIRLEELWLHDTAISDASVDQLGRFPALRKIDMSNSAVTKAGVARLRSLLPKCSVLYSR